MSHARILLVEDDPSVAQLVERCLGNSGYAICAVVPSGEEAIREVARLQPDLVLMDVALSGAVDGIEAARRVRDEHRTPVVFLTGLGDETTLERVQAAGAFGYLLKPFRPEEVRTSIEIALQRHRSVSALQRIEHWFSATIRAISDAVITTNESGTITFVNPVAAGLAGWAVNDAIGRSLGEVFHITDATGRSVVEDLLRPVLTEGRPIRLFGALTLHTRRQTTVPVEAEAAPIRNDQGQSIGVALVYRDQTERQRAEAALRESEE
ncbi:MAG TPA: response regulator, partial [Methylomirabilota bacterium]|nr:response regulator [Methylomirabilota bacterium]